MKSLKCTECDKVKGTRSIRVGDCKVIRCEQHSADLCKKITPPSTSKVELLNDAIRKLLLEIPDVVVQGQLTLYVRELTAEALNLERKVKYLVQNQKTEEE